MTHELQIMLVFALPLLAMAVAALVRHQNIRDGVVIALALVLFWQVVDIYMQFKQHAAEYVWVVSEFIPNMPIKFSLEPMGVIFLLILSFLWPVTHLYAVGYMRGNNEGHQNRFFAFFSFAIFAAIGVAFSANLLTLFIFYEVLTLSTYPLVTHSQNEEAKKSGRVYLGILMGVSLLFLLPGILWTIAIAGTGDFTAGGILRGKEVSGWVISLLLALYAFGIGKVALMPFHRWLPAAMVAPTPVSALLHAVAVVKAGAFSIVKVIVYVFGTDYLHMLAIKNVWHGGWLPYVAGTTVILASMIAMRQDNLKKRLAYSTVSQLSYIVMAAGVLTSKAMSAAAFHIAAHAFGKITLFFAAGAIYTAAHKKYVSQLSGIGRRMPWTMTAFTIATLSMIGIPPAVGFISKWYMLLGAFQGEVLFVVAVLVISTILNAAYLLPIVYKAFFEKEVSTTGITISRPHGEAPLPSVIALCITAAGVVILFFYPEIFMELATSLGLVKGSIS
jgi:multicomponent Na+:H+ antiporter subunit D